MSIEKQLCDVCGRSMTTPDGQLTTIGVSFQFSTESFPSLPDLFPEIEPDKHYSVCYVCWMRSLGIKLPPFGVSHSDWKKREEHIESLLSKG